MAKNWNFVKKEKFSQEYLRVSVASWAEEGRRFFVSWRRCEPVRSASASVWEIHLCYFQAGWARSIRCHWSQCCSISSTLNPLSRRIQRGHPREHPRAGRSPRRKVACIRPPSMEACFFHCWSSSSRHTLANWPRREAPWPSPESRQGPTAILDPLTPLCRGNFSLSWFGFTRDSSLSFFSRIFLRTRLVSRAEEGIRTVRASFSFLSLETKNSYEKSSLLSLESLKISPILETILLILRMDLLFKWRILDWINKNEVEERFVLMNSMKSDGNFSFFLRRRVKPVY